MKIGIIGTGNMGRILGCGWAVQGHEVFFGARNPQAAQRAMKLAREHGAMRVTACSNLESARFGDLIFYGVRDVHPAAVVGADLSIFDGKVVIDPNNASVPDGGFDFAPITQSLAEKLQSWLPAARVVKCFNTMAQEVLELPVETLRRHRVPTFIAANDPDARQVVATLSTELGLLPVDMGALRNARLTESLGDVIRYLILGAGLGPLVTLKVDVLPADATARFGGREASLWWTRNAGIAPNPPEHLEHSTGDNP